ncbi:hypothetical protein Dhaf_1110 [Desulfitobacterium hafniense DCB-2]|uniref:Uroporphyrinogen decarboxylase (URO-D) domain-containing protein n=1 Tax=Desulfitobacterium hafniense (strain DSM 10664 / DCB-2) TaxID=272564 RepID=B8FZU6_DESHD|nr:uroporphyrinogen decarboxylase family protein [Desulfitobacterium hafniense]ACL19170.1 hypothetical protein Dhaf_1110 [Desulfitobacterium hafniense DCB-2]
MTITKRENYLMAMNHEKPLWTPVFLYDNAAVGFCAAPGPWFEKGPVGGGYDGFGVRWITPESGSGTPIPAPNEYILTSETVQDWKKLVKFPNVNDFDWEDYAKAELTPYNRNEVTIDFGSGNGPFERLAALMGFEEALIALLEEPEACDELIGAIVDYKIEVAEKVAKYYKADYFTNYDDIATERGLFMSPSTFRKIIKPHTKRMYDAIRSLGMQPIQHTCGYAQDVIEDFIEMGAQAWTSVQPTNDIVALQKKYGDKISFIGGFNTNGRAAQVDATDEEIVKEVYRTLDTYGPQGSFIFFAYKLANTLDMNKFMAECMRAIGPAIARSMENAGLSQV